MLLAFVSRALENGHTPKSGTRLKQSFRGDEWLHGPDPIIVVVMLVLPQAAVPVYIVLLRCSELIHFKGPLQNVFVLSPDQAGVCSVLDGHEIACVDALLGIHLVVLGSFLVI